MTPIALWRLWLCVLGAALSMLGTIASSAQGDITDPVFRFFASEEWEEPAHKPYPSPGSGFEGPCGLAVDTAHRFYVADYYHLEGNVDVFTSARSLLGQIFNEDPIDGPCGLAAGPGGALYVNNFHRNVVKLTLPSFPFVSFKADGLGMTIDSAHPTGVAVDPVTGDVYVDDRTYIAVYDSSGAPVMDEGAPLKIGLGSLGDGYGVAVSGFGGSKGYVYVADAADNTLKVYDPALDKVDPVQTIDGHETPEGRFVSLRDSAVAVDSGTGRIYVADELQPEYYERPEAAIYGFGASGAYAGRLKYNIIDAEPPGLAVDSLGSRVYVTSGNSEGALVYAYDSLTSSVEPAEGPPMRRAPVPAQVEMTMGPTAAASPVAAADSVSPSVLTRSAAEKRQRILQRKRRLARQHHHRQHRVSARPGRP